MKKIQSPGKSLSTNVDPETQSIGPLGLTGLTPCPPMGHTKADPLALSPFLQGTKAPKNRRILVGAEKCLLDLV